ncbi:MAG: hypothetical protein ACD_73C00486G0002, partial [uncultured bacterium]
MKIKKILVIAVLLTATYALTAQAYKLGDRGQAPWHGSMYPAEIQKINGDQCFIHWYQESGTYDEWMPCNQFVPGSAGGTGGSFKEGSPVSVEWKGSWWPAHVIGIKPG